MHIFLARHGRTNYNDLALCNADPTVDVHLTKAGMEQATILADALKNASFECMYVSELIRTQQTAKYVNHYHHVELRIDKRLNDNRTGFEGKPATEYYGALDAAPDKWTVRFNDGESWEDVKERVQNFLEDLKVRPYASVLIVTSMAVIQVIYSLIKQLNNQQALDVQVNQGTCIELDI